MTYQFTRAVLPVPFHRQLRLSVSYLLSLLYLHADGQTSHSAEAPFIDLIRRENPTISKICFSYSCDKADYEDLRQDALINLWRGMKSFRGDSSERTWVYRIVVNSCLSTIRRQRRHRHESLDKLFLLIEDSAGDRERIEQLYQLINVLGATDRAVIMMWLDKLSYDEIAEATGMNRNTVATRIRRIKEKLKIEYKKEEKKPR